MMLFQDFQNYIRLLCQQNKLVRHGVDGRKSFFRMNGGEEALAAIPNNAASPYVVVTDFSGYPVDDAEKLEQYAGILFLSKASAQTGNRSDEVERAQQEALEVMLQFMARIKNDYENDDNCGPLQNLFPDRMRFEPVGPMNQMEYGWSLVIPFRTQMPGYDPAQWQL